MCVEADSGLSLKTTAELAGMSESYLSLIERGKRPVERRSTLEALANALRVAPGELAGDSVSWEGWGHVGVVE